MSDTDKLLSPSKSHPCEGLEDSDVDCKEEESICRRCFPHELHQEIHEVEAERKEETHIPNRKDGASLDPQPGHEELQLDTAKDVEFQQWSDGSSYRGKLTMNMKLGVGEFRWANGEVCGC